VRTNPESVAYLTGAQWADRLPALIQTRLIESFQNTHVLRAVGRPGMLADFSLHTSIRRFELDITQAQAIVEISAQIIEPNGRSRAAQDFSVHVAAPSDNPASVAAALDTALGEVMRDIVSWTARKI
jgi:cholesterol transport system auxiliary component